MWKTSCWIPQTRMIYLVKWGETREIIGLPSGKLTVFYGTSPCLRRKSTINVPFSIAMLVYQGNWFSWGDGIFVGSHFLFPSPRWWSLKWPNHKAPWDDTLCLRGRAVKLQAVYEWWGMWSTHINSTYPPVNIQKASKSYWKWPIEIADLPINSMVIF